MEPYGIGLIVWALAYLSDLSTGYPNGKVQEVCDTMIPLHGYSSQLHPKHTIEVNVTQFRRGDHVKGTVCLVFAIAVGWLLLPLHCLPSLMVRWWIGLEV